MSRAAIILSSLLLLAIVSSATARPAQVSTSSLTLCSKGAKLYVLTPGRSCRPKYQRIRLVPATSPLPSSSSASSSSSVVEVIGDSVTVSGQDRLEVSCPTGSRPISGWTETDASSPAPELVIGTWTISGQRFVMWTMPSGGAPVITRLHVLCYS